MATLQSITSEGSLPDSGDAASTGGTGEPASSFWESLSKRSPPRANGEASSPKKSSTGVLGWLAGLGSSGGAPNEAPPSPSFQTPHGAPASPDADAPIIGSKARSGDDSCPTGGRREGEGERRGVDVEEEEDAVAGHSTGVPRQISNERAATGDVPEVSTTPHTKAALRPAPPRTPDEDTSSSRSRHSAPRSSSSSGGSLASASSSLGDGSTLLFSSPLPAPAVEPAVLTCMECAATISGAIFMLHDQSYCCQRHRLVAYHKQEKEGKRPPPAPTVSVASPQGLRATYGSWM